MASLVGTYKSSDFKLERTLIIGQADDSTGFFSGVFKTTLTDTPITLHVAGHYHFVNDLVNLSLHANCDDSDPTVYEGWAGYTDRGYDKLNLAGYSSLVSPSGVVSVLPVGPTVFQRVTEQEEPS